MSQITVKELPIGIKIKVTKKRLLSIPKIIYEKVSSFYNTMKSKFNNYVSEDEKKAALKSELNKFDAKRKELADAKKAVKKSDDITPDDKKYYFEAIDEQLEKIKNKRKKRKQKGLGVFSIGRLYIKKYIANQKEKAMEIKAKLELKKALQEQIKVEKQEKELLEQLEKLKKEKEELIIENETMIKKNPNLGEYLNKIKSETKEKPSTKKVIPIKSIRKATEEEKTEIKKSSRFKKAVAALSSIVIAAGVVIGGLNIGKKTSDVSIETPPVVVSQEEQQKDEKIGLNDYINIENGSLIFENSTLSGKSGEIGTNGYDESTLFKINAVSYIDENNQIITFNLIGKNEEERKTILSNQEKYTRENPNSVIGAIHITPCNETGEPEIAHELGGWTNSTKSQINKVTLNNNVIQQNLGGIVK